LSLRISLVIIIVVSYVGIASAWFIKNPPFGGADEEDLPFFYTLSPDDIRKIQVKTPSGEETFTATFAQDGSSVWYFDEPAGIPVNFDRWGGIPFLLGGPKTARVLAESFENPSQYGLDRPTVEVSLTLRDGSLRTLRLGASTPDRGAHYAQMEGFPQLVLVDSSWGDVLARLANEPPLPQWYYTFDIGKAHEILFYLDNDVVRGLSLEDDEDPAFWVDCEIPIVGNPCDGTDKVETAEVNAMLEVIASPVFTRVEKVARQAEDVRVEEYGLDLDAPYLTVRIETAKPNGVTEVTMTTLTLGKLTPDGTEMYVLANEQPTVARVTAEWGTRVKALFDHRQSAAQR
jgi:hypothetical protein